MATDPPAQPEVRKAVAADLARAQTRTPGRARREAIEAVGREHYGDAVIERWLSFGVRPLPSPFSDPRSRSEVHDETAD
jgi:hypothetical protein